MVTSSVYKAVKVKVKEVEVKHHVASQDLL